MKKIFLILVSAVVLSSVAVAQGIKIYSPIAQNMLTDKGNFVRYSPVNMFDGDSATVYAVTFSEVDKNDYLLDIRFAEPAVFDALTIKAGYFDKKYFGMNDRIRDMAVEIWNCFNKDYEKSLSLKDIQEEQSLYSDGKIIATKIRIKVSSVYAGSKWDDLVISDLNFYLGGKRQGVSFGEGKCISGEDFKWYEYDEQWRLAKKNAIRQGTRAVAQRSTNTRTERLSPKKHQGKMTATLSRLSGRLKTRIRLRTTLNISSRTERKSRKNTRRQVKGRHLFYPPVHL